MSRRLLIWSASVLPRSARVVPTSTSRLMTRASIRTPAFAVQKREFTSDDSDHKVTVPATSSGMGHMWPDPFKMIKNFFIMQFMLPRIDPDFNLTDFMNGAKKAIEVVSHLLAKGDYLAMESLVEPVVVESLKESLKGKSVMERSDLAVDIPDIMLAFPYSMQPLFRNENNIMEKRIDILVVAQVLKGWGTLHLDESPQVKTHEEIQGKVQFVNYLFSRTYVDSKESSWLIVGLHHFKLNMNSS